MSCVTFRLDKFLSVTAILGLAVGLGVIGRGVVGLGVVGCVQ